MKGRGGGRLGGGKGDHNYNAMFESNGAVFYSWAKAIFLSSEQGGGRGEGRGGRGQAAG